MKKIINSLFMFILGGIIFGSIVYATTYYAKDVSYTPEDTSWEVSNVEEALNDLYSDSNDDKAEIIETGTISQYLAHSTTALFNFKFKNTYTEEDNARIIIYGSSGSGTPFIRTVDIRGKIVGNSKNIYVWNGAGTTAGDGTITINYAVVKLKEI